MMEAISFITRYKEFLKKILPLAWPIILQNAIMAALGMLDVVMLGHLGSKSTSAISMAAANQANRSFFIMLLIFFGISAGSSVFFSQFFGKKDFHGIRKILGVALTFGLGVSFLAFIGSTFFSIDIMHLFVRSSDIQVTKLGATYLYIIGFTYPLLFISMLYGFALRSIGKAKVPMVASIIALLCNAVMNYFLIYGYGVIPALGVEGAAIGTAISRILELSIVLGSIYLSHDSPLKSSLKELFSYQSIDVKNFFKTSIFVILQESLWGAAMTVQFAMYGYMGRSTIAAAAMIAPFIDISLVTFFAISQASSVVIGNMIGEKKSIEEIKWTAWRSIILSAVLSIFVIGFFSIITQFLIPRIYDVDSTLIALAKNTILIFQLCLFIRGAEMVAVIGVLRGAGDAITGMLLDIVGAWFIMVPIVYVTGIVLKYPLPQVQAFSCIYDLVALLIAIIRIRGSKWIKNVSY